MLFDFIDGLLEALAGLSPTVLYLLTGVFTMLETSALVGLLVPGDAVVLLAGTTATSPARLVAVVGAAVAGSLAGESIGYLLGRRFGTGYGPAAWAVGWARATGPRRRPSSTVGAAARCLRRALSPWSTRCCRWSPGRSGCPSGGLSAGLRPGRWPGRCCTSASAWPRVPPGASTA